jgi:hypothetical protein
MDLICQIRVKLDLCELKDIAKYFQFICLGWQIFSYVSSFFIDWP